MLKAEFLKSVSSLSEPFLSGKKEIAFAGKSNVGKSSFINFITGAKLSRVSKDPGRTRLINYFSAAADGKPFMLVDLPGYGYAKVSKTEQAAWGELIEGYLLNPNIDKHVFLLIDIRHEPSENDLTMLNFLYAARLPFTVFATKADKIPQSRLAAVKAEIARALKLGAGNIIAVSSESGIGKAETLDKINSIMNS